MTSVIKAIMLSQRTQTGLHAAVCLAGPTAAPSSWPSQLWVKPAFRCRSQMSLTYITHTQTCTHTHTLPTIRELTWTLTPEQWLKAAIVGFLLCESSGLMSGGKSVFWFWIFKNSSSAYSCRHFVSYIGAGYHRTNFAGNNIAINKLHNRNKIHSSEKEM